MEHKHDEAVEAQGNACMRRSTVLECIQEESELLLCFFLGNADGFEYLFLQVFLVNTERAAAGFYAIQYHIIGLGINLGRIGEEVLHIFIPRCGERMMFCHITVFFFTVFEHGEIGHPAEAEFVGIDEVHTAGHFKTQFAQSLGHHLRLVGNDEDQVAFFCFAGFSDFTDFIFAQEFGNLAFQAAVFVETNPCQTFSTIVAYIVYQAVQFTTRNGCVAFDIDGFNHAVPRSRSEIL